MVTFGACPVVAGVIAMACSITITRLPSIKQMSLQACWAQSTLSRMRGLLGSPPLRAGNGLLITPCTSVHTIGMRYPIDLVFLNGRASVIKLVTHLRPYRFAGCLRARHVLELQAGSIDQYQIEIGQIFEWHSAQ